MEAIMNLKDFYIQIRLDRKHNQMKRRVLSASFIIILGGLTLWLI